MELAANREQKLEPLELSGASVIEKPRYLPLRARSGRARTEAAAEVAVHVAIPGTWHCTQSNPLTQTDKRFASLFSHSL